MAKDKIIAALDVGSSKISCAVASVDDSKISVIGTYSHKSAGVKNGVVNNIDKAVAAISETFTKAEMMSGHPISVVVSSISGAHIESLNSKGVVAVAGVESEISQSDVMRVNEAAQAISLPSSREIIEVIPREYVVDKQRGIYDPTGMIGVRLEVEANIIHGSTTAIRNLTKCISQVGVDVDSFIYSARASAEAVLTDTEKELGTMLIDIGGGTIDMIIYSGGRPAFSAVIPIGGQDITNDLAIGLRSSLEDAEKIKLKLSKEESLAEKNIFIDKDGRESKVPKGELYVGDMNIGMETVPKNVINDIIFRRLEESFKFVQLYIKKAGYDKKLPAGVVLTGGTAQIKGIEKIAEHTFKLPVRVGYPTRLSGIVDQIQSPSYSTTVGVLMIMADAMRYDSSRFMERKSGNISGIGSRVVSLFKSFLP